MVVIIVVVVMVVMIVMVVMHSATITMKYLDPPGRPQTQWQMLTGYHRNHNS